MSTRNQNAVDNDVDDIDTHNINSNKKIHDNGNEVPRKKHKTEQDLPSFVWFVLWKAGEGLVGAVSKVPTTSLVDIVDFRKAIYGEFSNRLSDVAASELKVYEPQAVKSEDAQFKFRRREFGKEVEEIQSGPVPFLSTKESPFLVVSPGKLDKVMDDIKLNLEARLAMGLSPHQPDPHTPSLYHLDEGFVERDRYWVGATRTDRVAGNSLVLYRPQIVQDLEGVLKDCFDARKGARGIMVKGPQGVGKSYTLVNLVRKLMASNQYIVTFIPNCDVWRDALYLVEMILKSVGTEWSHTQIKSVILEDLDTFIKGIDDILKEHGMKWVFVFDQINRIFARPGHVEAKDIGLLPYPFQMMKQLMMPGRVVSIISASANNEVSHRENHEGFVEFEHCSQFSQDEARMVHASNIVPCPRTEEEWTAFFDDAKYFSGLVPLYLKNWVENRGGYEGDTRFEVKNSLQKLKNSLQKNEWRHVVTSATACLLQLRGDKDKIAFRMDRKFSFLSQESGETDYCVKALFPLAETAYRHYFWEDLVKYIGKHETVLLAVCRENSTTPDVCGRFFEHIVLRRLQVLGITVIEARALVEDLDLMTDCVRVVLERRVGNILFDTHGFTEKANQFPKLLRNTEPKLWIPSSPVFPAVDAIIHVGSIVFAIQITVSEKHGDVMKKMIRLAKMAEWDCNGITDIVLVYLCPDRATTEDLEHRITKSNNGVRQGIGKPFTVKQLFWSKDNLDCLRDIQWPERETKSQAEKFGKEVTKEPTMPQRMTTRSRGTKKCDTTER